MSMIFYGGAEVLVAFQPEGVVLPFLTLDKATEENPIRIKVIVNKKRRKSKATDNK